jgi:hypothetical protein
LSVLAADAPSTELVLCAAKEISRQDPFAGARLQPVRETLLNSVVKLAVAKILAYTLLVFADRGVAVRARDKEHRRQLELATEVVEDTYGYHFGVV